MLTYEQTKPWAILMKADVQSGKMPPWFADPHYGKFSNSMGLSALKIETLAKWADAGAPKATRRTCRRQWIGWKGGGLAAGQDINCHKRTMFPRRA